MKEMDPLSGGTLGGDLTATISGLGQAFVRQGNIPPVGGDVSVAQPVNRQGRQAYSSSIAKARAGALSIPANL